jgi:translation initiation factor 2 beta subunit (eIF-2beta)/eIF-5
MLETIIQLESVQAKRKDIQDIIQNKAYIDNLKSELLEYITEKNPLEFINTIDEMFAFAMEYDTESIAKICGELIQGDVESNIDRFIDEYVSEYGICNCNSESVVNL